MKLKLLVLILCCPSCVFAQAELSGRVDAPFLWRQAVGGKIIGQPVVQAQSVVFALDSGVIKAYTFSGKPIWTFSPKGKVSPYLFRSREGTSYICRTNGNLIAIGRLGHELWRINIGGALSAPAAVGSDGRIFLPAAKKIMCYTASGSLLWTQALDDNISAGLTLDAGGNVLLGLENGKILKIDPFGKVDSWELPAPARVVICPGAASGKVILAINSAGNVHKIDAAKANANPVDFAQLSSPPLAAAGWGGRAAVALENGQALLLSDDGKILWATDSHVRASPNRGGSAAASAKIIFDDRGVFLLTASGATAFGNDGRRLWFTSLSNASGIPAFDHSGMLYSGGADWILNAWKLDDRESKPVSHAVYGTGNPPLSPFAGSPLRFDDNVLKSELENIRREITAGRTGQNEMEWLAFLMETAGGGSRSGQADIRALVNHRIQALQLIARIGSGEIMPWLVGLFQRENDPLVRSVAAQVIGIIGVDQECLAIQAFFTSAMTMNQARDEQALVSIAAATGSICRYSGPQALVAGVQVLRQLGDRGPTPSVRRQAQRELDNLGLR